MDFSTIVDFVVSLVQGVIDFVVSAISELISILNVIFGAIWNAILSIVNGLVSVFQRIANFFVSLWQNYIKPAIQGLISIYKTIRQFLQQIFGPILRIIARIRAWYFAHIFPWVKLAQQILSTIRVFLSALRIVGVKWAAKLDADIQRIQSYITAITSQIVGALNQATTWLNFIVDPFGLVRKSVWNTSTFTSLPTQFRALSFGKNRYLSASESANTQGDRSMLGGGAAVLTPNQDGSVTYSEASKRINSGYDAAWQSFGGKPLGH